MQRSTSNYIYSYNSSILNPRYITQAMKSYTNPLDMEESNMTSLAVEEARATGDDTPVVRNTREAVVVLKEEMVKHWKLAAPIALTVLCNFMVYTITYIFVGHLGEVQLSAVAVSFTVIGTFTFGILLGMGSALETVCGQAYGAGEVSVLGIYMQRAWVTLFLTCLLLLPLYIFSGPLLSLLGQDPQIAHLAGNFNMTVIPRMFSQATSFPAQKFLQAQSKVWPIALSGMLGLGAHGGLMWVCVARLGWGMHGVAVAYNVSYWCVAVVQVGYVVFGCRDVWKGLDWEAFTDLWGFLRLCLASGVMLSLELWNSMGLVLLAGRLPGGVLAVGSLSICFNIDGYELMLFVGMNAAVRFVKNTSVLQGHPRAAKYAIYVAAFQSAVIGLASMVFIILMRNYLGAIFTSDQELRRAVSSQGWLLGLTMLFNVQIVLSGIAVGAGWQELLAYINFVCYYIFGLPLGVFLGYKVHLGLTGLWAGMLGGLVLQSSVILIMLYRTNWKQEVEKTAKRLRKWGKEDINQQTNAS